jgi:hypothetical protein
MPGLLIASADADLLVAQFLSRSQIRLGIFGVREPVIIGRCARVFLAQEALERESVRTMPRGVRYLVIMRV